MIAKSIHGNNPNEIEKILQQLITDTFQPTLAFVFLSVKQNIGNLSKLLIERNISIFGATTNGEFIDEHLGKESIAILLVDLNPDLFQIYFSEYADKNCQEKTSAIAKEALNQFTNPIFLISGSHMETDAEELLRGFQEIVGDDVNVFGGMAGDDFTFKAQFVFNNGQISDEGVVVLALDGDKIEMQGRALCGWKPMGTEKTVTKSEGNRVYTIDNLPALDITAKYGGITDVSEKNVNLLMEMATLCPLQLQRENGPAVMRPGLVVNWEDRSFFCSGKVPQGSKVKFSLPPDFDAIEEVIKGCQDIKEKMPEADAVIYFTCAGRLITFGPLMSEEIEGIRKVWKAPMIGMFSNAELGRASGGNLEMHNLSSCVVVLKEI